jgi:hypothetical protein
VREYLRVFTHRALLELLELHGFPVLETAGVGIANAVHWQSSPLVVRVWHEDNIACPGHE